MKESPVGEGSGIRTVEPWCLRETDCPLWGLPNVLISPHTTAPLRTMGEPFLPYGGALWIIRVVLLASVLIHSYAAVVLWRRARAATDGHDGQRYVSTKARRGVQRTYASFTLRGGGVVIALFVLYHLLYLTSNTIHPGGASGSPYDRVVAGFGVWWVTLSYTVALLAVGFHLRHGFGSAFADLGADTSVVRRRNLNAAATVVALVITVGFLVPPFAILLGWVGGGSSGATYEHHPAGVASTERGTTTAGWSATTSRTSRRRCPSSRRSMCGTDGSRGRARIRSSPLTTTAATPSAAAAGSGSTASPTGPRQPPLPASCTCAAAPTAMGSTSSRAGGTVPGD